MSLAPLTGVYLSDALLLDTFERMRRQRTHWPADYATAMAHPLVSRLVRINAALRARRRDGLAEASAPASAQGAQPTAPAAHRSPAAPSFSTPSNPPAMDRKRAAAADLD